MCVAADHSIDWYHAALPTCPLFRLVWNDGKHGHGKLPCTDAIAYLCVTFGSHLSFFEASLAVFEGSGIEHNV